MFQAEKHLIPGDLMHLSIRKNDLRLLHSNIDPRDITPEILNAIDEGQYYFVIHHLCKQIIELHIQSNDEMKKVAEKTANYGPMHILSVALKIVDAGNDKESLKRKIVVMCLILFCTSECNDYRFKINKDEMEDELNIMKKLINFDVQSVAFTQFITGVLLLVHIFWARMRKPNLLYEYLESKFLVSKVGSSYINVLRPQGEIAVYEPGLMVKFMQTLCERSQPLRLSNSKWNILFVVSSAVPGVVVVEKPRVVVEKDDDNDTNQSKSPKRKLSDNQTPRRKKRKIVRDEIESVKKCKTHCI